MTKHATIILIPARLRSQRLPDKPLAELGGVPMIVQVWRRGCEADIGPVVVACAEAEIAEAVEAHGGTAILTDPALPSGSDRILQALTRYDPERRYERIVNLQGDLPSLEPGPIKAVLDPIERLGTDMGTLARVIEDPHERVDPSVVKPVVAWDQDNPRLGRALYFSRATIPTGEGVLHHHIGIYGFRRAALEKFATLPASPLEQRERLEQLRALENGMTIGVALVETNPLEINTPEDLERAHSTFAGSATSPQRSTHE